MKLVLGIELFFIMIACSGCGILYGYKNIKAFDESTYEKFISNVNDTAITIKSLISDYSKFEKYRTNFKDSLWRNSYSGQPVQILYFLNDSLVSYHINCMAPGLFSKINWNALGRFDCFPPLSAVSLCNVDININDILDLYQISNNNNCVVFIFWTTMFKKISKSAIETVKLNFHQYGEDYNGMIYLINTDNYYIEKCN